MRLDPEPQDPSVQAVRLVRSVRLVRADHRGHLALPEVPLVPLVQLAHRAKQDLRAVLQARPDPSVQVGRKVLLAKLVLLGQVGHLAHEEKRDQLAVRLVRLGRVVRQVLPDLPEARPDPSAQVVRPGQVAQQVQAVPSGQADLPVLLDRAEQSVRQDPSVQVDYRATPALRVVRLVRLDRKGHLAFRGLPEGQRDCRVQLVRLVLPRSGTIPERSTLESDRKSVV